MNKINFDGVMLDTIKNLNGAEKLLLHSCCAPCSTYCISQLAPYFDLTVFYYNPNLDTEDEYSLRMNEQKRYLSEINKNIGFAEKGYKAEDFYKITKGLEDVPEGGVRCFACYRLRLEQTALYAKENGFTYFATTLTVSPLKNASKINEIGFEIANEYGLKYLPTDFKKRGGYLKSVEMSREHGLYRQNYCGCRFSKSANA